MSNKPLLEGERATERATDKQIGGNHYKSFAIAPIEFISKNNLSFIQGCVIKYICRFDKKNGVEEYASNLIEKNSCVIDFNNKGENNAK